MDVAVASPVAGFGIYMLTAWSWVATSAGFIVDETLDKGGRKLVVLWEDAFCEDLFCAYFCGSAKDELNVFGPRENIGWRSSEVEFGNIRRLEDFATRTLLVSHISHFLSSPVV